MTVSLELKIRALVEGLSNVLALNSGITATGNAANAAGAGTTALNDGLGQINPEAEVAAKGVAYLKENIGALVSAFAALAVAYGLKESADYAARTETLGVTMGVVAKNAGYGSQEISKYEKEVKVLGITTQATREAITQMIQSGLEIGPTAEGQVSQVAKLARAAQDLAVVTGENSSATLTRLITNISQLDTVGLRYMGLTVNIEAAEQQFALSIGKTVEQLTQKQKAQAVMNEALKQSEKLNGAYEASMDTVGKKLQSIKRYQEELANDIGAKMLPAYGALVDSATQFLKGADKIAQGIDRAGSASRMFGDGVSSLGNALGETFNTVLGIVGEIYPSIAALGKGALELISIVIRVGAEILTLGHYTDSTGKKFTVLGQAVNFILMGVAVVLAGLKDGIDVTVAAFYGLGGASLDIIGKIISGFGKLVEYVNKGWGKAIQGVGDGLQATGQDMIGFADTTVTQFSRGESAVGKYQKSLLETALYQQKLAEVTDFSKAEAEVLRLTEAVRKSGRYTSEFADQSGVLNDKLKDMQTNGQLTTDQLGQLQKRLQTLASDDAKNFSAAVNDAGLKLAELDGKDRLVPLNKEFATVIGTVQALGNSTKTTADVMTDAFAKGVDSAKTLAELNQIGTALGDVKKVSGDIGPALVEVSLRFEELFNKSLKAAKTERDYADLRAEVERLGKAGTISGQTIARALKDIEEKSKGAEAAISRINKSYADIAKSNADMARSHLEMVKAQAELGRANLDVLLKQNEYHKSGTELAKEELNLAKINKQLATEKAAEAKLAYQIAFDSLRLTISLQEKLNADKELELHIGREDADSYKERAKLAADAARLAEDSLNLSRSQLSSQQAVVSSVEEQKVKQELARDIVKETNVAYELNKVAIEGINNKIDSTAQSQSLVTDKVNETKTAVNSLKGEIEKADSAVGTLITDFDKASRSAGNVKVPPPERVSASNPNRNPLPSSTGREAGQDPYRDKGDPTDPGSLAAAQKRDKAVRDNLKERYGGLGPVGKDDVTTSEGEHLRNTSKGHYENESGVIVDKSGKPSATASDGFGAGAMDNDIANMLFDAEHGKKIEPTAENKQRAQTAWNAAKANKEMYDANTTSFSAAGADSILRSYNRAKTLAESMGINTSGGDSVGLNDGSGGTGGFAAPGSSGGGFYRRVDGSHKGGLDRVPKDGYVAELHEDEKVLTAPEAANYRNAPTVSDLSRQLLNQITFPRLTDDPAFKEMIKQSARPAADQKPEKVVQVNLSSGGKTVPVTVAANNERAFLDMLKRAKGTAS